MNYPRRSVHENAPLQLAHFESKHSQYLSCNVSLKVPIKDNSTGIDILTRSIELDEIVIKGNWETLIINLGRGLDWLIFDIVSVRGVWDRFKILTNTLVSIAGHVFLRLPNLGCFVSSLFNKFANLGKIVLNLVAIFGKVFQRGLQRIIFCQLWTARHFVQSWSCVKIDLFKAQMISDKIILPTNALSRRWNALWRFGILLELKSLGSCRHSLSTLVTASSGISRSG